MPSASPSPVKRPSLVERTSSTHSLSSSGKQSTAHKAHRPHVVNRHSRNISHGKNLSKLNKVNSSANITDRPNHQRKKSGAITPSQSPKAPDAMKRNSSHVTLQKNMSHGNLRKNHSANTLALARNTSHPALKKLGLAPAPKTKDEDKKAGFFELGDQSSDDAEEAEWEDSTTHSPELTRDNSKVSTPARIATPNGERLPSKLPDNPFVRSQRTSSPPAPSIKNNNRSVPDFRRESSISPSQIPQDPPLLHSNGRASRAPPAVSTVSAHAGPSALMRSESSKSFTHISHDEAASMNATPGTTVGVSSSGDGGVSHFLTPATPGSGTTPKTFVDDGSDEDLHSNFMSNYRPQPSESPEKPRTLNRAHLTHIPSRTQQKLELQRRETMRAAGGAPATPSTPGMGLSAGSSISLHSRSGSRGRNRSLAEEIKALKQDYETGIKQLTVVRRFRNPFLESLSRLKDANMLPNDIGIVTPSGASLKSRPQSRRGLYSTNSHLSPNVGGGIGATANGAAKSGATSNSSAGGISRSFEDRKPSLLTSNASSRGARGSIGRVHFQRQGSHDDIGITPSQGSPDDGLGDEDDGFSPEEALMRRIWESREVYEAGDGAGRSGGGGVGGGR